MQLQFAICLWYQTYKNHVFFFLWRQHWKSSSRMQVGETLTQCQLLLNLKSASFIIIMLLHEDLTHIHSHTFWQGFHLNGAVGQRSCHLNASWATSVGTIASRATWLQTHFSILVELTMRKSGLLNFVDCFFTLSFESCTLAVNRLHACQCKNMKRLKKIIMTWTTFFWIGIIGLVAWFCVNKQRWRIGKPPLQR